jgi:hypothetical protein
MATATIEKQEIIITPPRLATVTIPIIGTTQLVVNKFGKTARETLRANHAMGSAAKKTRTAKEPKNFDKLFAESMRVTADGKYGIHAGGIKAAMVRAAKDAGLAMTDMKSSGLLVRADGFDKDDDAPLVFITPAKNGGPKKREDIVRNDTGVVDIRVRTQFDEGWKAKVRIRFPQDKYSTADIVNLLARVGSFIGIHEGRSFSPNSCGCDWGQFEIDTTAKIETVESTLNKGAK